MSDETDWLRAYARDRSQEPFRALVDRYVDVVYSAARRQVGDADLARDVTQAVFLVLAEKAEELSRRHDDHPLASWLLKVTRYASSNAVRARGRRAIYERRAAEMAAARAERDATWDDYAPLLDEGMAKLRDADRDVLVLRFFDRKTVREVAESLNISEDAAEKRVARALEKLRELFRRRGVVVSATALGGTLATNAAADAAPVGLNASIATTAAATAPASTAGAIAKGTVIAMATAKTKSLAVAAICLLLLGGAAVVVTTKIRSATPRQVTVSPAATRPTSLPALVVTSAAPPPAVTTFGNGTTFELLGITDAPGRADRWWAADGTPIAAPSPLPTAETSQDAREFLYQVLVRKTDPMPAPGKTNDFSWSVGLSGPEQAWMGIRDMENTDFGHGGSQRLNFIFAMTNRTATGSVSMQLGHAPWTEDVRLDLPAGGATTRPMPAPTSAPATQPTFVIEKVADGRDGKAEVTLRVRPQHERDRANGLLDQQLFLIDAVGKLHVHEGVRYPRKAPPETAIYSFEISARQAVAVEYRYRPWERREFRNVSLVPGQKTIPVAAERQIKVPPAK